MAKIALKERLIGAVVIACLALIFYPLFLSSKSEFEISRTSLIPPQQVRLQPLEITEPSIPYEVENIELDELFNPDEEVDQVDTASISDEILADSGIPHAWVVQVGSFALVDNAELLNQELISLGYESYYRLTPSFNETPDLYKVFVGPVLRPNDAQQLVTELTEHTGNEAILLKFEP